jgi:hypothetical protein
MGKESLSKRASRIRREAIKLRRSMKSNFSGPVVMSKTELMQESEFKREKKPDMHGPENFGNRGGTKKRKTQKKRKTSRRK